MYMAQRATAAYEDVASALAGKSCRFRTSSSGYLGASAGRGSVGLEAGEAADADADANADADAAGAAGAITAAACEFAARKRALLQYNAHRHTSTQVPCTQKKKK